MSYLRDVVGDLRVLAERVTAVNKQIEDDIAILKTYYVKYQACTKVIMELFEKGDYFKIHGLYCHMCHMKDFIEKLSARINEHKNMRVEIASMNMFIYVVAQMRNNCNCKICQKATIKLKLEKEMKVDEIKFNDKIDIIVKTIPLFEMVVNLEPDMTSQETKQGVSVR